MEELLGDLRGRGGSRRRNHGAGVEGATQHSVGGHELRRRHHDWLLLLGRWRKKGQVRHAQQIIKGNIRVQTMLDLCRNGGRIHFCLVHIILVPSGFELEQNAFAFLCHLVTSLCKTTTAIIQTTVNRRKRRKARGFCSYFVINSTDHKRSSFCIY